MSRWTHITACLSVDTDIKKLKPQLKTEIKNILKDAPKITGSEADADIFINIPSGYNCSLHYVNDTGKRCFEEYQTCVVISIQGDLRDRTKRQTKKEFEAFKNYIEKYMYIRDYSVNIDDE